MTEFWYRYEDYLEGQGYTDVTGDHVHTGYEVRVRCWRLQVLRKTPKGTVVLAPGGERRFIADHWTKKYACPTRQLAVESFVARKTRQASIYERRASDARKAAADAVTLVAKGTPIPGLELL